MGALRFSTQLRLTLLLPALIALAAAAIPFWISLSSAFERGTADQLNDSLTPISNLLRPSLQLPPEELQARVATTYAAIDLRLTVISEDGTVLADSARTESEVRAMDNHRERPEVLAAFASGNGASSRRSATTARRYAYVARLVEADDGRRYVVRLAEPLDELVALRTHLARLVTFAALAILVLSALVSGLLARRLFEPLAQLSAQADRLNEEESDYRIPLPEAPELAKLARSLNRMADRVTRQLSASEAERSHLDDVLESMTDGVLVTDRVGRVRSANPSLRRLFEIRAEPAGRMVLDLTRQPEIDALVENTLSSGASGQIQLEVGRHNPRTIVCTCSALSDGQGVVMLTRDITDSTRLHAMRRDFVANVSHELRTPLTAIRGYVETLRDGAIEDRATAVRFVDRILRQCRRLQALLDDLLTLSRLENADVAAELDQVDLAEILRDAAEMITPQSIEKRVIVRIEAEGVPAILGDPGGLERVCSNLLENAVKYNRPGGEVVGRVYREGDDLVLEVRDSGIGIPREAQSRVFERFYRVDKGRSRGEGGTGLGLAIVKHVAQLHDGRVEVESEPGEGTRFRVILPIGRGQGTRGPQRHGPASRGAVAGL